MGSEGNFDDRLNSAVQSASTSVLEKEVPTQEPTPAQQQAPAQQTQQQAPQEPQFSYEYERSGRKVRLDKQQLDELMDGIVENWETAQQDLAGQKSQVPGQPLQEGQPAQDPLMAAIDQRIQQLERARNDDLMRREREDIEREFSSNETFKNIEDKTHADLMRGFLAFIHSRRPHESLGNVAKVVSSMFEGHNKKAIDAYVKGKLKQASKVPEGTGGNVAVTSPKKMTGKDFKEGKLAKVAEEYLDSLESGG